MMQKLVIFSSVKFHINESDSGGFLFVRNGMKCVGKTVTSEHSKQMRLIHFLQHSTNILQLAMQLTVLLQTKRSRVKPNCNRLVSFTPLKAWRRNLSKKADAGKELDFPSQSSGIASCKECESSSIITDTNRLCRIFQVADIHEA
jgi:hypothetical protein